MDAIYKEVRSLSATELRHRLLQLGDVVGPITTSTLSLFQKKLARKLLGDEGGGDRARHDGDDSAFEDDTSDSPRHESECITDTNTKRGITAERNEAQTAGVKSGSDSSTCTSPVYYGVSLPQGVYTDNGGYQKYMKQLKCCNSILAG